MDNDYLYQKLMSKDVSFANRNYMNDLKKEVKVSIICSITSGSVTIPIKHEKLRHMNCLFDINNFIVYYNSSEKKDRNFKCPGCRGEFTLDEYGIDRQLYQVLQCMEIFGFKGANYSRKSVLYDPINRCYYALNKKEELQNPILIPGIANRSNRNAKLTNVENNEVLAQATREQTNFIKDIIKQKVKQVLKAGNQLSIEKEVENALQVSMNQEFYNNIKKIIMDNITINNLYRDDVQANQRKFVFGFYKVQSEQNGIKAVSQSLIILYFVSFQIWHDYFVKFNGQDFTYNDGCLALKSNDKPTLNQIYLLGGVREYNTTREFYLLEFETDPQQVGEKQRQLELIRQPDLPYPVTQGLGLVHNGNVILLGGTLCKKENNNITRLTQDEIYAFEKDQWTKKGKLKEPRLEGQVYYAKEQNRAYIFGGYTKDNGEGSFLFTVAAKIEIIDLDTFQSQLLDMKLGIAHPFSLHYRVIATQYFDDNLLLISGRNLLIGDGKQQNDRMIFKFNLLNGSLSASEELYQTPIEIWEKSNNNSTILVDDLIGEKFYGNFYTIYKKPQKNNNEFKIVLCSFNMNNGQYFELPFIQMAQSQKNSKEWLEKLTAKKKIILIKQN